MKVVHLNTSVNQSSAPLRLHKALCRKGIESKILVLNEGDEEAGVFRVSRTFLYKCKRKIFAFYRNIVAKKYHVIEFMPFTIKPIGIDVSKMPEMKEADVIFLHWICGDYMSPKTIGKILDMGKPVLWACHDNFPFTGGCHVRLGCNRYEEKCGCCPQIHSQKERDITAKLVEDKQRNLEKDNLFLTSPSKWMDRNVSNSAVFRNQKHYILPNAIDTEVFIPHEKEEVRKKLGLNKDSFLILMAIKGHEKIPYNGTVFLKEIFRKLSEAYSDGKIKGKEVEIIVFGTTELNVECVLPIHNLGYIKKAEDLSVIYCAADVYVITSLEDSFNQTAAECMSCGTPVVAFRNGGIEDIIDHKVNGYLAQYKDVDDIMKGITMDWKEKHGVSARKKIEKNFSYEVVADRFLEIVKDLC